MSTHSDSLCCIIRLLDHHIHTRNWMATLNLVGNATIKPSKSLRNLGVKFDSQMSMEDQVTNICKFIHYHLQNTGSIRNVLTDESAAQLVHALISSRLDYCNSLLIGIPDVQLRRLQKFQKHAAWYLGVVNLTIYSQSFNNCIGFLLKPVLTLNYCYLPR